MTGTSLFTFLMAVYESFMEACNDPIWRGAIGLIVSAFVGVYFRGLPQPFGQIAFVGSILAGFCWLVYCMWASSSARYEQAILEQAVGKV